MKLVWNYTALQLLQLLLCLCIVVEHSIAAESEIYNKAVCLASSTEGSSEIYLQCGDGVLYIRSAQQGFQEKEGGQCEYMPDNECSIDFTPTIVDNCQGKSECTASASSLLLGPCGIDGNYVQVQYECIHSNSLDEGNILDICGDYQADTEIQRTQGYLESLNYPYVYSPNTVCTCRLRLVTNDPNAQIVLSILDYDLAVQVDNGDWLEYARGSDFWGRGKKLQKDDIGRDVRTGLTDVMVNFHSDFRWEKRGFWLKYQGLGSNMEKEESVKISCGKVTPSRFRKTTVCFDKTGRNNEMYLSCQSLGVINVLRAHHGYSTKESLAHCSTVAEDTCVVDSFNRYNLLEKCMGQMDCVVNVDEIPVPVCSQDSNYFQVYYQCVEDVQQFNIIDICGDITGNEIVLREEGYIESLNYPQDYPPSVQCECSLEATKESAELILSVLDMQVDQQTTDDICKDDWLEYRRLSQDWSRGTKICDAPVGDSVRTGVNKLFLNFQTGEDGFGRGFWIKYYGRDADGNKSPVKVQCSSHGRLDVLLPKDVTTSGTDDSLAGTDNMAEDIKDAPVNLSLIVGLCAIGLLMLIILLTMVVYKYKFQKANRPSSNATKQGGGGIGSGVHLPNQMDNGYSTFAHSPYRNLSNASTASSSIKSGPSTSRTTAAYSFGEPEPDYADPVHFMHPGAKTGASKAYINPAFNGNLHA